ncbi:uncharacterized protein LOC130786784 [Actinidia eriantha]|uniref:uncharacterized protein LOC130786784 n=1 Tax=Actinidia eriantha TaxID=165200 RepID=UPI002586F5EC|nr:uncharacterized protein LOC130786784 [Actinidia eriantha]XP_057503135.1 uncharacterized protein LOC130786784 [Actinidia eriantha]XP_057503136.1 uncharacterized protein LOC130786784 [Actinidia eriantha]XP_057503137.1 uncharacterized protein LOC130786784 [Actinidia eriantha]XP_057503138.1 uncharacterized protein LOC130786784 [Actinidia eriantha]XP_057503139.1 uncharacterized protein LOC130786784 [Actinidia eriantha]XP_057503140.1 uncharacterized protein LOC130786784 [Actinidia eriantha]XP_0
MSPPRPCLTPSSATVAALFPPPKPLIPQPSTDQQYRHLRRFRINISRREATSLSLLSLFSSLHQPPTASAFSIGISGPKDWLREQKKKSSKYLLAPIDASRNILRSAYLLLTKDDSDYGDKDVEEVQTLLRSAARDCIPQERNSFVAFQAKTGVEVCTFQLVVKNASSLLDDNDPIKLEAEAILRDLIRSFTSLNAVASETGIQFPTSRQKVGDALMDTISSLNKFEQGIKDCLEI